MSPHSPLALALSPAPAAADAGWLLQRAWRLRRSLRRLHLQRHALQRSWRLRRGLRRKHLQRHAPHLAQRRAASRLSRCLEADLAGVTGALEALGAAGGAR